MQITSSHVAAATSTAIRGASFEQPWPKLTPSVIAALNACVMALPAIDRCLPRARPPAISTSGEAMCFFGANGPAAGRAYPLAGDARDAVMRFDFWTGWRAFQRLHVVWDGHRPHADLDPGMRIPFDLAHAIDCCVRATPLLKRWLWADHPPATAPYVTLRVAFDCDAAGAVDMFVGWSAAEGLHAAWLGEPPAIAGSAGEPAAAEAQTEPIRVEFHVSSAQPPMPGTAEAAAFATRLVRPAAMTGDGK